MIKKNLNESDYLINIDEHKRGERRLCYRNQ